MGGLVIISYLFLLEGIIIRLIQGQKKSARSEKNVNRCKCAVKKKKVL